MARQAKRKQREVDGLLAVAETADGALRLEARGHWTVDNAERLAKALEAIAPAPGQAVTFDLSGLEALDTAGAWFIAERRQRWGEEEDREIALSGAGEDRARLVDSVAEHAGAVVRRPPRQSMIVQLLLRAGRGAVFALRQAKELLNFLGLLLTGLALVFAKPRRLRPAALVTQMERTGLDALPIVGLLAFLIGVVLAYQGADQLSRFGAEILTVNLVGISVLREMGILITAIIVAGRSGSAFAAQIGTMKVNEEVDAMRTIGLDPMEVLVIPRVLGLVLVMPLLTFYADMLALAGGAAMTSLVLDISLVQFMQQLNAAVPLSHFWVGMMKAPLFAFVIAMVGCFEGLKVSVSAESVGLHTTRAVVESVFLVIVLDAILSVFFSTIHY